MSQSGIELTPLFDNVQDALYHAGQGWRHSCAAHGTRTGPTRIRTTKSDIRYTIRSVGIDTPPSLTQQFPRSWMRLCTVSFHAFRLWHRHRHRLGHRPHFPHSLCSYRQRDTAIFVSAHLHLMLAPEQEHASCSVGALSTSFWNKEVVKQARTLPLFLGQPGYRCNVVNLGRSHTYVYYDRLLVCIVLHMNGPLEHSVSSAWEQSTNMIILGLHAYSSPAESYSFLVAMAGAATPEDPKTLHRPVLLALLYIVHVLSTGATDASGRPCHC
uniref:Uncharacterized protein n=1 Tax=Craspedostauros australis TaxID=1486917 RepID=A0A7R9WPW2_9STRA